MFLNSMFYVIHMYNIGCEIEQFSFELHFLHIIVQIGRKITPTCSTLVAITIFATLLKAMVVFFWYCLYIDSRQIGYLKMITWSSAADWHGDKLQCTK